MNKKLLISVIKNCDDRRLKLLGRWHTEHERELEANKCLPKEDQSQK